MAFSNPIWSFLSFSPFIVKNEMKGFLGARRGEAQTIRNLNIIVGNTIVAENSSNMLISATGAGPPLFDTEQVQENRFSIFYKVCVWIYQNKVEN